MKEKKEIKSDKVIKELKESCKRNGVEGYLFATMDKKNDEEAYYFSYPKNITIEDAIGLLGMISGRVLSEFLLFFDAEKRREVGQDILDDSLGFVKHIEEKEKRYAKP